MVAFGSGPSPLLRKEPLVTLPLVGNIKVLSLFEMWCTGCILSHHISGATSKEGLSQMASQGVLIGPHPLGH